MTDYNDTLFDEGFDKLTSALKGYPKSQGIKSVLVLFMENPFAGRSTITFFKDGESKVSLIEGDMSEVFLDTLRLAKEELNDIFKKFEEDKKKKDETEKEK